MIQPLREIQLFPTTKKIGSLRKSQQFLGIHTIPNPIRPKIPSLERNSAVSIHFQPKKGVDKKHPSPLPPQNIKKSHLSMMPTYKNRLAFLLVSVLFLSFTRAMVSDAPSAYEMLERFNFPKGILPEGVQSYTLNQDGSFEVFLRGDCEFKVDGGYLLKYQKKITGKVESGLLRDLRGVNVKVVLIWFGINGVARRGGDLNFYIGPLSASFPLSNFEDCPKCRCEFDCTTTALVADS